MSSSYSWRRSCHVAVLEQLFALPVSSLGPHSTGSWVEWPLFRKTMENPQSILWVTRCIVARRNQTFQIQYMITIKPGNPISYHFDCMTKKRPSFGRTWHFFANKLLNIVCSLYLLKWHLIFNSNARCISYMYMQIMHIGRWWSFCFFSVCVRTDSLRGVLIENAIHLLGPPALPYSKLCRNLFCSRTDPTAKEWQDDPKK